jgi:hypothetical protein
MNDKDAFYFSHDSNAKDDPKCMMLIEQLGLEGYGIFWILVEMLRDQPDYKYPLSLLPAIARRYNTTTQKVETVVKSYNLFRITEDECFFSISLVNRMKHLEEYRLKKSKAGKKGNEIRWNNRSAIAEKSQCDGSVIASKVKESKVKESKERTLSQRNKFSDEGIEIKLAAELYADMKENNPSCKKPNLQSWASNIDMMLRVDKRNVEDIRKIIDFSQHDNFWKSNILSTNKLREKFDQLILKANSAVQVHEEHKSEKEIWT